jgi:hypothetical protein
MGLTRNPSRGVGNVAPKALDPGFRPRIQTFRGRLGDGERARLNFRHRSWLCSMPDRVDAGKGVVWSNIRVIGLLGRIGRIGPIKNSAGMTVNGLIR